MSILRRINNEIIKDWTDEYQNDTNIHHIETNYQDVKFIIFLNPLQNPILITMDITNSCYPFKPPKVYIGHNKKEYKTLLHSTWSFSEKIIGNECMCCNSILCKWSCQYCMKDIVEEIKKNFNLKIRMMEIAHCKKIVDKYFGHYLPIEEFL